MYLAYLDESGDPGLVRSPTTHFVLSCVLVHDTRWLETLDQVIDLRRRLRDSLRIPTRAEIKAAHFKVGKGVFRQVVYPIDFRMTVLRALLTWQQRLPIKVFAIAIDKAAADARGAEPREAAWRFALQRIHTFCRKAGTTGARAMIFPDEGHGYFIRRLMRRLRRYHTVPAFWGPGHFHINLDRIIEDPNDRSSALSYLAQLADWNAYAAHRSQYVAPSPPVPGDAWDELGPVLLRAVNQNTGGPPGIVLWPRP
jgi:hypothetical protein